MIPFPPITRFLSFCARLAWKLTSCTVKLYSAMQFSNDSDPAVRFGGATDGQQRKEGEVTTGSKESEAVSAQVLHENKTAAAAARKRREVGGTLFIRITSSAHSVVHEMPVVRAINGLLRLLLLVGPAAASACQPIRKEQQHNQQCEDLPRQQPESQIVRGQILQPTDPGGVSMLLR